MGTVRLKDDTQEELDDLMADIFLYRINGAKTDNERKQLIKNLSKSKSKNGITSNDCIKMLIKDYKENHK